MTRGDHLCNEKEIQPYVSGMFQLTAKKYHSQEPSQDLVFLSMSIYTQLPCSYLVQVNAAESPVMITVMRGAQ